MLPAQFVSFSVNVFSFCKQPNQAGWVESLFEQLAMLTVIIRLSRSLDQNSQLAFENGLILAVHMVTTQQVGDSNHPAIVFTGS